nr:TetR/AcrR family transcriptional regulator C-terminal domain-containing protein [Glycomyces amatae]
MADTAAGASRPPPAAVTGWRARLEHEAREEWRLYRRHPWLLRVLATTRPPLEPGVLAGAERSIAAARDAGLPASRAMAAYLAVSGLVQGLALLPAAELAAADSGPTIEEWWRREAAGAVAALAEAGGLPHLSDQFPAAPFVEFDALFESALATLLDGVAAQVTPPNK